MVLLRHSFVPVANERDATETALALAPHLDQIERVTLGHVIETRPGAINKAPTDKLRADAERFLAALAADIDDRVTVETRIVFGDDVAQRILDTAVDVGATAIVFRSRERGRLVRLLSGETATGLVKNPTVPVVSLADHTGSVDHGPETPGSSVRDTTTSEESAASDTERADSGGRR
nr:universal stress protein [Salinirubrum litoreum]